MEPCLYIFYLHLLSASCTFASFYDYHETFSKQLACNWRVLCLAILQYILRWADDDDETLSGINKGKPLSVLIHKVDFLYYFLWTKEYLWHSANLCVGEVLKTKNIKKGMKWIKIEFRSLIFISKACWEPDCW